MTKPTICTCCGEPITPGQAAMRMRLPEIALDLPEFAQAPWSDHYSCSYDDPIRSDWMRVSITGAKRYFTRVLLPVHHYEHEVCVWLETDQATQEQMGGLWDKPKEYMQLRAVGQLANSVPPWGDAVLGAEVTVATREPGQLPYIVSSTNPTLLSVLKPLT